MHIFYTHNHSMNITQFVEQLNTANTLQELETAYEASLGKK